MGLEDASDRSVALAQAFVELAGGLANGYDLVDLLDRFVQHCVELLAVDAGGLVLADSDGTLKVMVSTSEQARFLEVLQLHADGGPCLDCYRTARPVNVTDLRAADDRWPALARAAQQGGYRAVHAVPLSFQGQCLGAMNLFTCEPTPLETTDHTIARALAEVAAVAIMGHRGMRRSQQIAEQLQTALHTRTIIEQAKGMLAQQGAPDMTAAFATLRKYARRHRQNITDAAHAVLDGTLTLDQLKR